MIEQRERRSTIQAIVELASPAFIVVAVGLPIALLLAAMASGSPRLLNYTHIMTGSAWTGIDLFMGFVLGPAVGGLLPQERAAIFRRLIPKMTFLMPVLATVTLTAGFQLTMQMGLFLLDDPRILVSLTIAAILTVQGFGMLLPNEIRIFRQLLSPAPDVEKIGRLGMFNAKLGGIQGVLQVAMIFTMATLRF